MAKGGVPAISGIRAFICCFVLGAGSIAMPAEADSVAIPVSGTIVGGCGLFQASNFAAASLATSGSTQATASVDCNTAFTIHALSSNGTLRNVKSATAGFVNVQPYSLTFSVPLNTGGTASATCPAASLVAGQASCVLSPAAAGLSSGTSSATAKTATLTAQWMLGTARLIAGAYQDTLTISIAARP